MAKIEDLAVGTKVSVTSRNGATGIICDPHTMDNTVSPARPVAHIRFDGHRASYGLNYPEQVEVISDGDA